MGKKDKQNAAESTPEKNTAQQPTADEAAKTAETAKADETAEKSAEPETFTVTREQMEKMEGLAKSLADEQDKYLRLAAEYDNYRKRTAREADQKFNDGVSHAVNQILAILDTLDMAANAECTDENYKKGVVMTLDKAEKALKTLNITEIESMGKPFDPNFMNAVQQVPAEDGQESGTVVRVFQKGYMIGDKIIRHATVVVAE